MDLRRILVSTAAVGQLLSSGMAAYWAATIAPDFADSLSRGGAVLDNELGGVRGLGPAVFVGFFVTFPLINAVVAALNLGAVRRRVVATAWALNLGLSGLAAAWLLVLDNGWRLAGVDWFAVNSGLMWPLNEMDEMRANALTVFTLIVALLTTGLLTPPLLRPDMLGGRVPASRPVTT